jgi:hypothetical protein
LQWSRDDLVAIAGAVSMQSIAMNARFAPVLAGAMTALVAASLFIARDVRAQDLDLRVPESIHSSTWMLDAPFWRDYPQVGTAVSNLPEGYVPVNFGGERFYFQGGVWYQASAPGYVIVDPPTGITVPSLPPGYTTVWVGEDPYYYSTGIYYLGVPGGYEVTLPPMG